MTPTNIETDSLLEGLRQALLLATLPVYSLYKYLNYDSHEKESGEGPLTSADLISHHILARQLQELLPEAAFISEESPKPISKASLADIPKFTWIVDPIDGTREFKAGKRGFAISVGLLQNGQAFLGGVCMPAEGILLTGGQKHKLQAFQFPHEFSNNPFLQARPISLKDAKKSAEELLATKPFLPELQKLILPALEKCHLGEAHILVSRSEFQDNLLSDYKENFVLIPEGSIARKLAMLAMGHGNLVLSLRPKHSWDICGGHALLMARRDFVLLDLDKAEKPDYTKMECISQGLIAGPALLVQEFLEYHQKPSKSVTSRGDLPAKAFSLQKGLQSKKDKNMHNSKQSSPSIEELQTRIELLSRGCGIGLWEYELKTGQLLVSPRWQEILAYNAEDFTGDFSFWKNLIHADDLPGLERLLRHVTEKQLPDFELEYRMRVATGDYRWMRLSAAALYDADGELVRLAGSQMDINEDKAFDPITGLPNQILFQDRLEQAFYRARADRRFSFAVLIVSIDRFQRLIDDLGHSDVERLMQEMAERLQKFRREADTLARHTQNDFIFLIEDTLDISTLSHRISELPNLIGEPIQIGSTEIILTSSIGFALYHENYRYPMDLLKDAIVARKHSQAAGGNRSSLFNSLMEDQTGEILKKEMDLRKAIEEKQMRLFYQPIVDAKTLKLRGFETLVRWEHPERGLLNPDLFIRLSEETGLIVPLGDFILEEAMDCLLRFKKKGYGDLFLSVNLSAQQLNDSDFLDRLQALLKEYPVNPAQIKLEITESVAMHSIEATAHLLTKIHQMGFAISIDDFGTGYSSLSYLKRLPISVLKIDRSFVVDIVQNKDDQSIVQAILALSHQLALDVVVEGVEEREQVELIRSWGCEYFQGFYFGRPIDSSLLDSYLSQNKQSQNKQGLK